MHRTSSCHTLRESFSLAQPFLPFSLTSTHFRISGSVHELRSGRFGLAVSVWPIRSEPFRSEPFRSGRFGLAVSVMGHFGRDIFIHKELMKFVDVNEYPGRIIIYAYNTIQIKLDNLLCQKHIQTRVLQ